MGRTYGKQTRFDYVRLMTMIKKLGFNGFLGLEYEGDRLGEEEGTLATKQSLLKVAKDLS